MEFKNMEEAFDKVWICYHDSIFYFDVSTPIYYRVIYDIGVYQRTPKLIRRKS